MLDNSNFNSALAIFQEFGPGRSVPIRQRWQEAFPDVTPEVMTEWERQFRELGAFALDLAKKVRAEALDINAATGMLAERFSKLNSDRLGVTFDQAMYFACRE